MFSDSQRTLIRNLVIGLTVGASVSAVGIASASVLTGSDGPKTSTSSEADQGVPGGYNSGDTRSGSSLSAHQATASVLDGLRGTPVKSVEVIDSPDSSYPIPGPWVNTELEATSIPTNDEGGTVEAVWLGGLAQGAVADLMRAGEPTTAAVIGGGQVVLVDASGEKDTRRIGTGSIIGGQVFNSPSDAELKLRAERAAEKFGLTLKSVEVLHPLDSAISVTFVVPSATTADWTLDALRAVVDGDPKTVEGSLIRLESDSGESLLVSSGAYRIGSGGLWFAPGQDSRFGAGHGGAMPKSDPKD